MQYLSSKEIRSLFKVVGVFSPPVEDDSEPLNTEEKDLYRDLLISRFGLSRELAAANSQQPDTVPDETQLSIRNLLLDYGIDHSYIEPIEDHSRYFTSNLEIKDESLTTESQDHGTSINENGGDKPASSSVDEWLSSPLGLGSDGDLHSSDSTTVVDNGNVGHAEEDVPVHNESDK